MAHAQVAEQDRAALIALYQATTVNEPWDHEYGFSQAIDNDPDNDVPVSGWQTTDPIEIENGRVVYVNLYGNNLNGTLPDEICNMDALRELDLGVNHLSGSIPACIGNMAALTKLDIAGQDMRGSLPESLSDLANLEVLDLRFNQLTGSIPASLGDKLVNLIELHLQNNQFNGAIPLSLGQLANLQMLNLGSNQLTGSIPASLGDLAALQVLDFRGNQLTGSIPAELGTLASLTELDLASNQLAGTIPAALGGLNSLQQLYLQANALTEFEPGSYAGWAGLQAFYVDGNQLRALPDLSGAGGLTDVGVASNYLTFADLEPLAALNPSGFFSYRPQRTVLDLRQTIENGAVVLSVEEDGMATLYQWERWDPDAQQWVAVPSATERTFTPTEAANYRCALTNPLLPDLTITSSGASIEEGGLIVNSAGDAEDAEAGDGVCDTGDTIERDGEEEPECTLRAALQTVNNPGSGKTTAQAMPIAFDIPGEGVPTLVLGDVLPPIENPVSLDGTTQAEGTIHILGSNSGVGIEIRAGGSGSTVKGFIVAGFAVGMGLFGASDNTLDKNTLTGNGFGIGLQGNSDLGTSARNVVRDNVIGGNVGPGINLSEQVTASTIEDNFIGTERDGISPLPNGYGIVFVGGPQQTMIRNNVISGNDNQGIVNVGIERGRPTGLVIEANKLGTGLTATNALPNGHDALLLISVRGAEVYNNIVAGNQGSGLRMLNVSNSIVEGNYIGTNEDAASNLGNRRYGLLVKQGRNLRIDGNVIVKNGAGQGEDGIHITYAADIQVRRNGIGVFLPPDATLDAIVPLGNAGCGVYVNRTTNLRIEENIIADNGSDGVCAFHAQGTTVISENLVGVEETVAGPVGNRGHGISLTKVGEGEIIQNVVVFNGKDGVSLLDAEEVIVLFNVIADNNQAGVRAEEVAEIILDGNELLRNLGLGTGIHLTASHAAIQGNTIVDDAGDAITLEDGSTATVTGNNIFGNAGMGLNNLTPSVMVTATGNWWGDASGPGGQGPGTGDEVSAGVDVSEWLDEMVAVVAAAEADEILLPTGEPDTVSVFLQNWQHRTDVLDLTITDTGGWLQSPAAFTISLNDTTGAVIPLDFAVPASTPNGTTSTVEVTATSQSDGSHTVTTTFTLITEGAALAQVRVVPDAIEVAPGDTVFFEALGLDQFSRSVEITPTWSATGGEIDANGLYVAGDATGEFMVTATDPATGLSGTARVGNGVSVAVEEEAEVPEAFHLAPNYPNPFNPETTIGFTLPEQVHVRLVVYDVIGREVAVLVDAVRPAGMHTVRFDARTLSSGMYLYQMQAGSYSQTRAMVLLR